MSHRPHCLSSLASLALLAMLLLPGALARADIPGAADPKAYTQHDFARGKLEFGKRTLAGAYQAVGKKNPKWDAAAIKLLDALAVQFAYGDVDSVYRDVEPVSLAEAAKLGKAAIDAGCDDPLVAYCHGLALAGAGQWAEAKPFLVKAAAGLVDSKYPPYRICAATRRAMAVMDPATDVAVMLKYRRVSKEMALAALMAKVEDRDLRYLIAIAEPDFESATGQEKLEFCKALARSKDTHPWLVEYFNGQAEVTLAWDARGGGWAQNVTPEGWQGFREHLVKARDHLAKAHQLHPEFPEAATAMIPVAMGGGANLNERTRDWFDKAVRAQLDYPTAYTHYAYSIYPRWGGSHERMVEFGRECVATGRFDTTVPYQLMGVLDAINHDSNDDYEIFRQAPVRDAVRGLFAKLIEKTRDPGVRGWYGSYQVALAWRIGNYAEAAALLDKLPGAPDTRPFTNVGAWAPGAISQVRVMNTAHAQRILQAEKELEEGEYNAAILGLLKVSGKLAKDHPGQLYLKFRARSLELQKDFAGENWVPLKPDADFAPWAVVSGDWKLDDDGAFVATADASGVAVLVCRTEFGPFYEIRAKIDSPDPEKPATAGLIPQYAGSGPFAMGGVKPKDNSVFAGQPGGWERKAATIKGGERVSLKVDGDRFSMALDEKPMIADRPLPPGASEGEAFVGLGVVGREPGATARFTDVEIRLVRAVKRQ